MSEVTNNGCFGTGLNPIVPTGGYDTPIDEGSLGGNSNGNNTGSGNGSDTPNDQGSNNAPPPSPDTTGADLYTPLAVTQTISTNKKLITIRVTNYPNDIYDIDYPTDINKAIVLYDYTLISPLINYTITKNLSTEAISFYTFIIKFYKSTIVNSSTEIFSDEVSKYIKINPLQMITKKMICNYYYPHYVWIGHKDKVKAITIALTDSNSELDVNFTSIDTNYKIFAISRM